VVVATGEGVHGFQGGERVVSETAFYTCGECAYCQAGLYNLCPQRRGLGYLVDGVFADYFKVPAKRLHRFPDSLPFEEAVLIEPTTVTVSALVASSSVSPGDTVAIIGPGAIGLLSVLVARAAGATSIVMIGRRRHAGRLRLARELGATTVVDSESEDAREAIKAIGDGLGAHLVVDVTGAVQSLDLALDIARRGGQITEIGFSKQPPDFSLARLVNKAIRLQGIFSHNYRSWERAVQLVASGRVDAKRIVSGYYPLADWERALLDVDGGRAIKAVLVP
jgi:alcohol dehydrogenase/L-iditol 2-dehydrogenase